MPTIAELEGLRAKSLEQTRALGLEINPALPLLDEDMVLRTPDEIVARLLCMHVAANRAYGFKRRPARKWMEQEGLYPFIDDSERKFIDQWLGRKNKNKFIAQIEGMWALAWVLTLFDDLDFLEHCSDELIHMLPRLVHAETSDSFRRKVSMRPLDEVAAACDLVYCLHWAMRDALLQRQTPPIEVPLYLIEERRRALDWAVSKKIPWNEVPLDT